MVFVTLRLYRGVEKRNMRKLFEVSKWKRKAEAGEREREKRQMRSYLLTKSLPPLSRRKKETSTTIKGGFLAGKNGHYTV